MYENLRTRDLPDLRIELVHGRMKAADKDAALFAPCPYGMGQTHKHLPEMQKVCGLTNKPVFTPIVDDYYKGMATTIALERDAGAVYEALAAHYDGCALVSAVRQSEGMLAANTLAGKDTLELIVCGNEARCTVTARFDNLGKGASGAAVQNMNLMLGFDETAGLSL